jgi:hypothetical protein
MFQLNPEVENWAKLQGQAVFFDKGASPKAALLFARLYGYAVEADLNPVVTSIYRSMKHQKELQERYDLGFTQGLRVRPATTSKHLRESRGEPASDAMDMPCSSPENDRECAKIARQIGLRTGESFTVSDAGHYDVP